MVEKKSIEPHVPLWEKGERNDGTFSRSDFVFDLVLDRYTCPGGKPLLRYHRKFKNQRTGITKANSIIYRATQSDCASCKMKAHCCPNTSSRKVPRSVHEAARDVVRRIKDTPEYQQSMKDRKKVEMLFAHLKRILNWTGFDYVGSAVHKMSSYWSRQLRIYGEWLNGMVMVHQIRLSDSQHERIYNCN